MFSVAAHIPNPNTVAFVECAYLEEVTSGGGTSVQDLVKNDFNPTPLPTSRFAFIVDKKTLVGLNNDTTILSLLGDVPAAVAMGERNSKTWVPVYGNAGGVADESKFNAKFGNMLANIIANPMSPLRVQQSRFQIPAISTEEYTQEALAAPAPPPAREGNNWFGRHTYASCMADMKQEVGANGFLLSKRSTIVI